MIVWYDCQKAGDHTWSDMKGVIKLMENKLLELALRRRSVRRYTNEHIDDSVIDEIMKTALTAPCSFGHRPVEYVVVRDPKTIRDIADCKSLGGSQIIGADAVIVVMVKLDRGEFWIEDGAIASSYILLAAEQYDLGACWVHIRNRTVSKQCSRICILQNVHGKHMMASSLTDQLSFWPVQP